MEDSVSPARAGGASARLILISLAMTYGFWLDLSWFSLALLIVLIVAGPIELGIWSTVWAFALSAARLPFLLIWNDVPGPFATVFYAGETFLALFLQLRPNRASEDSENTADWRVATLGWMASVSLGALLIRAINPAEPLCWALTYVCAAGGPVRAFKGIRASLNVVAANLALAVVSVLFCCLVAEVGLRAKYQWMSTQLALYEEDPQYHVMMRPDARISRYINVRPGERRYLTYEISHQGLRDVEYGPKQPGEYRILMLGDSFTVGTPVSPQDTIPKQLERILRECGPAQSVTVINAGSIGAGPLQELGVLRKRGLALNPDLVVLQLFLPNDVHNVLWDIGELLPSYLSKAQVALEAWRLRDAFPFSIEVWLRSHSRLYSEIQLLIPTRTFAADFFQQLRWPPSASLPTRPPSLERHPGLEPDLKDWYPQLEKSVGLLMENICAIRDECRAHGADLLVYCIPGCTLVDDGIWNSLTRPYPGMYERYASLHRIEERLQIEGIPTVSVLETLQSEPDIDKTYFSLDGHLTEYGNQLVARRLAEVVSHEYLSGIKPPHSADVVATP